jgi:aspartate racemase
VDLAGLGSFREVLARTRAAVAGAAAHRLLPFERLVDILRPERALDHTPVFQVMLGWVEPGSLLQSLRLPGVTATPVGVDRGSAKVDLTLLLTEMEEEIVGEAEYSTDLFDGETVGRMLGHFRTLLEGIVADPAAPPWRLPLMAAAERERVLVAWNDTRRPYPADRTVHALVAEQAAASPEAVAVVAGDRALTYGELDRRADQLARHLRARGVGPEVPVAIAVERSPEMVVGLLGILRAGGAYVPLDPADPRERLAFLLADTGAPVVLTLARLRERLPAGAPGTRVICLDADWPAIAQEAGPPPEDRATPDTLAYVTYTSGSTGRPKGVCVPHRGIVRLVRNADYARLDPGEVCLQLAPLAFDASTFEIWGSLLNGARLVLHPAEPPSPAGLARVVRRHGVTTLWLTAALFHEVVDGAPGGLPPVRQLLAGGDVLSPRHVGRVLREWPGVRLVNGYGPTENTTFTCCHTVTAADLERPSVPIGRPIANTRVYVLDRHGEPVPVGVPGELHAAGDGLARGYLNCPDLTAERFVPDPWSGAPGARLYRTGDLVRWRPDGTLEFLGRTDAQVKVRGFRVEPGEVEAALGQHPAVREAVVTAREDRPGERRLVAYLVPREGPEAGPSGLRRFLAERLPAHMIPAAFVTLTALPLTPTGKVDRSALPAPEPAPVEGSAPAGPMTPGEALVARVWAELLERPDVRARDDFFALGGHSLLATRLVARLEEALGFEVPVALVFEAPTVAGLAARLQALGPLPGGGARAG